MADNPAPRRAHNLILDIDADNAEALARSLETIAHQIRAGQLTHGMSGGYDSGWIHSYAVDGDRTHGAWAADLKRWLAGQKEARRLRDEAAEGERDA